MRERRYVEEYPVWYTGAEVKIRRLAADCGDDVPNRSAVVEAGLA